MYSQQIVAWGQPLEGRIIPTPLPQGTEVLVRVSACGICHSDLHIWEGGFNLGGGKMIRMAERNVKLPLTLGHEIVGSVAALGPDAKGVEIGAQRVVFPWIGCGTCEVCQRGEELLCNNPRTPGTRRDGGYSDHVIVPHPRYLIDYTGVPAELACTYACSGITAYSALKKAVAVVGVNDHLLIIGTGGVGLAGVHLASSMIKGKVIGGCRSCQTRLLRASPARGRPSTMVRPTPCKRFAR
ncbi:MAG: alcohol dehydrogenase catalytic domain-containing protein [Gammaproteobacteria bacterium]